MGKTPSQRQVAMQFVPSQRLNTADGVSKGVRRLVGTSRYSDKPASRPRVWFGRGDAMCAFGLAIGVIERHIARRLFGGRFFFMSSLGGRGWPSFWRRFLFMFDDFLFPPTDDGGLRTYRPDGPLPATTFALLWQSV